MKLRINLAVCFAACNTVGAMGLLRRVDEGHENEETHSDSTSELPIEENIERMLRNNGEKFTELGRRQKFKPKDFVFDLVDSKPEEKTPAGTVQTVDLANMKSLFGQGVSYTLYTLEPCAINLPQVHPRASEIIFVISGKNLRTAFVEENGDDGRVIVNDIKTGYVTFVPEGLLHYQQNLSCDEAVYISAYNNDDPGTITVTTQFFDLPKEAIEASLGVGGYKVHDLIKGLPENPAEGHKKCLKRCSYSKSHHKRAFDSGSQPSSTEDSEDFQK